MTQDEVNSLYALATDIQQYDVKIGSFLVTVVEHLAAAHGLQVQLGPPPEEQVVTEVPPVEERAANATEPQAVATKAGGTTWFSPEHASPEEQRDLSTPHETRPVDVGQAEPTPTEEAAPREEGM